MFPWEILEIDPSTDERLIKAAYARRLKVTRPDEHPEGFQTLRAAYETALSLARDGQPSRTSVMPGGPARTEYTGDPLPKESVITVSPDKIHLAQPAFFETLPETVAVAAWERFVQRYASPAATTSCEVPLGDIMDTPDVALAKVLKQPEMDPLEVRDHFKHMAIMYCAQEEASSAIRRACLTHLDWQEDRNFLDFQWNPLKQQATYLALADQQFHLLQTEMPGSPALQALLMPGVPIIVWRTFYAFDFASDMRKWITEIRTSMPEAGHARIGEKKIASWADAAFRPWPTLITLIVALFIGLGVAVVAGGLMREAGLPSGLPSGQRDMVLGIFCVVLFLLPVCMMAAYPRYVHRPVQRWRTLGQNNLRVRLGWWIACMLLSTAALLKEFFPFWSDPVFLALICILVVGDGLLSIMTSKSLFILVGVIFIAWGPMCHAFTPFVGPVAFFMPVMASALLYSFRHAIERHIDRDWQPMLLQAGLFVVGILLVVAVVKFTLVWPLLMAVLGWWWILAAAATTDIFMTSIDPDRVVIVVRRWMCFLGAAYHGPQSLQFDSAAEGLIQLQITFACLLGVGLVRWCYRKILVRRKPTNRKLA